MTTTTPACEFCREAPAAFLACREGSDDSAFCCRACRERQTWCRTSFESLELALARAEYLAAFDGLPY